MDTAVIIESALRNIPSITWQIRCAMQPFHGLGYAPLMDYVFTLDLFRCRECGQEIKAEDIYWTLPKADNA